MKTNVNPKMIEIRESAQRLAEAHRQSVARATALEHEISQAVAPIYVAHRAGIDAAAEEEAAAKEHLQQLLDAAPGLFTRPRSITIDGVKCGYRKEQDSLDCDDVAAMIRRIRALDELSELAGVLVRTEESLNIAALDELDPALLRKIGVRRVIGGDSPFIAFGDTDVERMVKAILADAAKRQGEDDDKKAKKAKAKVKEAA